MRAYERLIKYARVHTSAVDGMEQTPSASREFNLANMLAEEMKEMGMQDVFVDEHSYVYARLPATPGREEKPCVGFIAHLDTVPDFPGENVKPCVVENYAGGDIPLGDSGRVLSPRDFPHLSRLVGRCLVTTDGTTVLGADDKAGIAEILTMAETLLSEGRPHGPIAVGFCPDEEIGHGAQLMDLERFGADFAYTVDGGEEGGISYENFNACAAIFRVKGFSVHPGEAKDTMINASVLAMEINSMLPAGEIPRDTEGYEGFYHLIGMQGDVSEAEIHYIIRDHDPASFEARQKTLRHIEKLINARYGAGTVSLEIQEQYRNMAEMVKPHFHVVETALEATRQAGLEPRIEPVRGGTDGAQLTYRGLVCPNLSTGGFAFHGPYEHASAEGMDKCVEVLLNIVDAYAN